MREPENSFADLRPPREETPLRVPPQSVEAEQSLIGGLLLDSDRWEVVADRVEATDFYRREHRLLFTVIAELCNEARPADVVTVCERLERSGELEVAGGLVYVGMLANNTPSTANLAAYADIVREHSLMRQMIQVSGQIADRCYRPESQSASDLLDAAERDILKISEKGNRGHSFQKLSTLVAAAGDRIDELSRAASPVTGVSTGYPDLDDLTAGLQRGDLVIIAGRPSMGKTALAMNLVENAALGAKVPVAVFSLEMPGEQLAMRMLASLGRINAHHLRKGSLRTEDWPRLASAMGMLGEAPIFIDDSSGLTPMELRARARRLKREHDIGLIVIDYLQLMQGGDAASENRATEISSITRSLKGVAKELDVPVIALSQLNRSLEQRPNKRPVMSDLRESGAIEQDADVIAFVYRDEVYNEDSPDKGTAEILIAKQRNGPIGKVRLTFLGEFTRFESFANSGGYEHYG